MITDGGDVSIETVDRMRELIDHVNHEPAALPTARAKSDIFRSTSSLPKDFEACFESYHTLKLGYQIEST